MKNPISIKRLFVNKVSILLTSCLPAGLLREFQSFFQIVQGMGFVTNPGNEIKHSSVFIKKNPVKIIDIGANKGEYTEELIKTYPDAEKILIEPSIKNCKILIKKFKNYKNIKIYNFALSNINSNGHLYSDKKGSSLSSLYKRDFKKFRFKEKILIKRFDSIFNYGADFCKIDAEGSELNILKGMGKLIKKNKIIQFEFGGCNLCSKNTFKEFWDFFNNYGAKLYILSPSGYKIIDHYDEMQECYRNTTYLAKFK